MDFGGESGFKGEHLRGHRTGKYLRRFRELGPNKTGVPGPVRRAKARVVKGIQKLGMLLFKRN